MKITEFRKLIKEEVRKVLNEAKLDPNGIPDWADSKAKKELKAGKWTRSTTQTKLKVGNEIVRMGDMMFAEIVKIAGDKVFLQFDIDYADEKPIKKTREQLEDNYILTSKK